MKLLLPLILTLSIAGCATPETKKPSDSEQVAGLQTMCKDSDLTIKARQAKSSLYLRLGEKEKIRTLATNLFMSHTNNKQIGHMFTHVEKGPFVDNVTAFLVMGTGGGGKYTGRSMDAAHKHLKITNADFLSAGDDVQNVMKNLNYGENEIQEVICALVAFVPVVVIK